jgi:alpha-amylase
MSTTLRGTARAALALTLGLAACSKETTTPASPGLASQGTSNDAAALNGVMLQGFYWDVPISNAQGTWWQVLGSQASDFAAAGFTAVWLPPAYKGWNPNQNPAAMDEGYGVYDRYDLGEFNQKGSVATRYGTLAQLQNCITALHGQNLQVYEDMVMNHLNGADSPENITMTDGSTASLYTKFTYPGRGTTYSNYNWQWYNFNGQGKANGFYQWHAWDFATYDNNEAYDALLGDEIRYSDVNQVNETIAWGKWLTTKLNLDGYRIDAAPHMLTSFLNTWFDQVNSTKKFAVSEAWFDQVSYLTDYVSRTGGRTSLFDFPLHNLFVAMSSGNGAWDMQGLKNAGFTEVDGAHSVSFVDNHDTDNNGQSPVVNLKMLAYAYILLREKGYPCVFYKDYYTYNLGAPIKTLMGIRKTSALGAGAEYASADTPDYYAYSRAGDGTTTTGHKGLMLVLNDSGADITSKTITSPFKSATLTDKTGNYPGTITTNSSGVGTFPVKARSWSVWVVN